MQSLEWVAGFVKSSHYYLYSAFNNANCVKAVLHQLDLKLGGFISALQYLDGELVSFSSGQTNQQFNSMLQQSQIVQRTHLVPVVLS